MEKPELYCPLFNKDVDWEYCADICTFHSDGVLSDDKVADWGETIKVCKACTRYTGAKMDAI